MPRTTDRASELHRWSEKQAAHQQRECAPRRLPAPTEAVLLHVGQLLTTSNSN